MAQYSINFSGYTDDVQPSDWSGRWNTGSGASTVRANSSYSGGKYLEITKSATNRYAITYDGIDGDAGRGTVIEVYTLFEASAYSSSASVLQVLVGGSGATGSENGIYAEVYGTGSVRLGKYVNGTATTIGTYVLPFTYAANVQYWIRLYVTSANAYVKLWRAGEQEPVQWSILSVGATSLSAGWVGIMAQQITTTRKVDQVLIGTGGDAAPTGQDTSVTTRTTQATVQVVEGYAAPAARLTQATVQAVRAIADPAARITGAIVQIVYTETSIEITDVNGDEIVRAGELATITGFGFGTVEGTVVLSPSTDINDVDAVVQSVYDWTSDTQVIIAVDQGGIVDGTAYLFVTNDNSETSPAFEVLFFGPYARITQTTTQILGSETNTAALITQSSAQVIGGATNTAAWLTNVTVQVVQPVTESPIVEAEYQPPMPFQLIGIVLDVCANVAGGAPCTATETGNAKCYNTYATCNDKANYVKTTKEYKFCQPRENLPIGENMIPALKGDVKTSPTSLSGGAGLGNRAVIRARVKDFPHHDRGIDPYWSERTYDAEEIGTFWPRFLVRNAYYEGRALKVYTGFLQYPFDWDAFRVEYYDITEISGPDKGEVEITAKDILIRTYGKKSKWPAVSNGKLIADITAIATTATLTPTDIGAEYPASGVVAIGSEAISFTRSGDVLTFTERGAWGTEAKDHKLDDAVQICAVYDDANVLDILEELLVTASSVPAGFIPNGVGENWDVERTKWLSGATATGIVMKPEAVDKLIAELCEQFQFDIWFDAVAQLIKIKAVAPNDPTQTINTLDDTASILSNSFKLKRDIERRITEVDVWYGKVDYSKGDDIENFSAAYISVDAEKIGENLYNVESTKVIKSRWINNTAQASQLAGRMLNRFSDTPLIVNFEVMLKDGDKFELGGAVNVDAWQLVDNSGARLPRIFQVLEIGEAQRGHSLSVKAIASTFTGRYAYIGPNIDLNYSAATDEQKAAYGFIADNSGNIGGDDGYKIG